MGAILKRKAFSFRELSRAGAVSSPPVSAGRSRAARAPTIARWLLLMSGAVLFPVALLVSILLITQYRAGVDQFEASLISSTRGLALEGEALLNIDRARLEALSVRPALQLGNFAAFETELRAAARTTPGWFVLMDDQQQQIINTRAARGTILPRGGFPEEAWRALQSGRTRVSGVTTGKLVPRPIVAIDTPVVIGSRLYSLSYIQEPSNLQSFLTSRIQRPGWIGVIIDRQGRIVARSYRAEQTVGGWATPDLRQAASANREGSIRSRTLEGRPSILSFSRAPSGWTFALAVPQQEIRDFAWRAVLEAGTQLLVLLAAASATAAFFSQRIVRDLTSLESAAAALGQRRVVEVTRAGFAETERVRSALLSAADQLRRHDEEQRAALERHRTLVNELNHRVKNTLATVQGLARQSLGKGKLSPDAERFEDRLLALSRAHDLLTANNWRSAELGDLARAVLEPYSNTQVSGPSFAVSSYAAVSLILVLHELATNAAKYGALADGGSVALSWRLTQSGRIELDWTESCPTELKPRGADGFGSRLIRSTVERELKGAVEQVWLSHGVHYRFCLPLSERLTGSPAALRS